MPFNRFIINPDQTAIYIHWPYCLKKCPYCDFNSHVSSNFQDQDKWRLAYIRALEQQEPYLKGKKITSIFFGGGTPSLMSPDLVGVIIEKIKEYNLGEIPAEVTIEANPSSFEAEKFKLFYQAGVNRISIGVQSFDDQQLKYLGRLHSAQEAIKAIDEANNIFNKVSFDLMNGLRYQSLEAWDKELMLALPLVKSHVSIYELTIEPGTAFYTQKEPAISSELGVKMMEMTIAKLAKKAVYPYEISNYSKIGYESIHNLNYWQGGGYVGVGPGAHGRVIQNGQIFATFSYRHPDKWLAMVMEGSAIDKLEIISEDQRLNELLLSQLRLYNRPISNLIENHILSDAWQDLINNKLLERKSDGLYLTHDGVLRLNSVISYLSEHQNL